MEGHSRAVWVSSDVDMGGTDDWELLEEAYLDGRRGQLVSYDSVNGVGVGATAQALEDKGLSDGDYELISKTPSSDSRTGILATPDPGIDVRTIDETGYVKELRLEGMPKTVQK